MGMKCLHCGKNIRKNYCKNPPLHKKCVEEWVNDKLQKVWDMGSKELPHKYLVPKVGKFYNRWKIII
jgi:hypothetical protein